jgi:hypothetical protein
MNYLQTFRIQVIVVFFLATCLSQTMLAQCGPFQVYEGFGNGMPTQGGSWSAQSISMASYINAHSGDLCIAFNAANDNICTPKIVSPQSFSFWYKRDYFTSASSFTLEYSSDSSNWTHLSTVSNHLTTYQFYSIYLFGLNNVYVRIRDTRAGGTASRFIDDISWSSTNTNENTVLIQGGATSTVYLNQGITYTLYDIGGYNDDYTANLPTRPLKLMAPAGYSINANIEQMNSWSGDYLRLYNGTTTSNSAAIFGGSGLSGNYAPGNFTSTDAYGDMTVSFYGSSSYSQNGFVIKITSIPNTSCYHPTYLNSSAPTNQGITLNWSSPQSGTPTSYEYEIRSSGAPGSGPTGLAASGSVNAPALSTNVTGLTGSTTYNYYMRSSCGGGIYSIWNYGSFTTGCPAVTTFPDTETFSTYLPCWTEASNGTISSGPTILPSSNAWGEDGFLNSSSTGAAAVRLYAANSNMWLLSKFYTLGNSGYRLKYNVGATENNSTNYPSNAWETDDYVELLVSTNGLSNWTVLKTYNNANVPNYLGQEDIVLISAYLGQTVRFAFRAVEGSVNGQADINFFIDNFTIEPIPTSIWNGSVSNDWTNSGNWAENSTPLTTNDIIIPGNNVANFPSVSNLVIGETGSLRLQTGAQLDVSGGLQNNGTFIIESGATLVQPQGVMNSIVGIGVFKVEQAITGDGTSSPTGRFWYLGSPLNNASSALFFESNPSNILKKRDEANDSWTSITQGAPENLVVGKGYYTRAIPNATILTFTGGTLNNGNLMVFGLTRTAGQGFEGFNLVSNPYPSYLDWDLVSKTNVDNTIWYRTFDGTNMVFDTYVAGSGGIGTNLSGNTVTKLIPPMQAFWVRVSQGETFGYLTLNNSMRSHFTSLGGSTSGLRSTQEETKLFLRMNLLQADKKDQLIVYVNETATNGFDILDGEKMMQAGFPQFYTKAGDKKIVINGLNSAKKQQSLPITMELPTTGVHSFVIEDLEISNGLVWLEDKQEEIIQALEPGTVYEFYAASGLNAERFVLHFQLIDDAVRTNVYNEVNSSANFSGKGASVHAEAAGVVVIKLPASTEGVTDIQIRDAAGKVVYTGSTNTLETSVQLEQANGIYYVTLNSNAGVEVRKVFIQQ